jgi:hypothetical protein
MLEISLITDRFEGAGISYCIVGGMAAIAYGRPRLTLDADLVVSLQVNQIHKVLAAFPPEDFYIPPEEVLLSEIQRPLRGHFNILHQHSALRADCYLPGQSELAAWELKNRQLLQGPFGSCWFSPPEAVVVHKLAFYREGGSQKHIEDIRAIIQSTPLDPVTIQKWISALHLDREWSLCQQNP